jgi:hypothetical protein
MSYFPTLVEYSMYSLAISYSTLKYYSQDEEEIDFVEEDF